MIGAAFGAGRSDDEPTSRQQRSYDTYGHNTSHPLRYTKPFVWMAHKTHIERAAGAFAASFMSASGAQYAGYPRQQAGLAFEQADMIMARATVLKRSNGQLWKPARTTHELSSTDSKISALFDYKQRPDTITSMGATCYAGERPARLARRVNRRAPIRRRPLPPTPPSWRAPGDLPSMHAVRVRVRPTHARSRHRGSHPGCHEERRLHARAHASHRRGARRRDGGS